MRSAIFSFLIATLSLCSANAFVVVNIDIDSGSSGTYAGVGAAPDSGTIWNSVNNPASGQGGTFNSGTLLTSTGGATSITFSGSVAEASTDWASGGDLFRDGVRSFNGNVGNFSFSGLSLSETYDIYLYSAAGSGTGQGARFAVSGYGTQDASGANGGPTFVLNSNYVVFSNITGVTSVSGTYKSYGTHGAFNGAQVVAVPEPSTLGLAALGLLFLGYVGCRRGRLLS